MQVHDTSGTTVEAPVDLRDLRSGSTRTIQSDTQGATTFTRLPFGRHRLRVSRSGFAPKAIEIDVQSATPVARTITLEVAATTTKVDAVASTPLPGIEVPISDIPAPVQIDRVAASFLPAL